MKDVAIEIKHLSKTYSSKNRYKTVFDYISNFSFKKTINENLVALREINLTIYKGETFGIIGRNGSGKSSLLNIILGAMAPDKGSTIRTEGRIMKLTLGMGFDPELSARDNIYVNGSIIGLSFKEIAHIYDDIIIFAGIQDFQNTQVKYYSKGMKQRLLFSTAIHAKADIFLLDEFFGGTGDLEFRRKSNTAFQKRIIEGKTNVIVSHSIDIIKNQCERCLWIEKGMQKIVDKTDKVINSYTEFIKSQ